MKTTRNILVALVLNLGFSVFEVIGGLMTGSIAIMSDAIHDFGDALGIGIALYLERKSKRKPDAAHTFGYARYSILGAAVTTLILIVGSVIIVAGAVERLIVPVAVNYDGMIIFGVIGVAANAIAAWWTRNGDSLNQKSVNLHMVDDVLGWVVVLAGSILMKVTSLEIIDPIMSILVAAFIGVTAVKNFREILNLFLEKTPKGLSIAAVRRKLKQVPGVKEVRQLKLWSLDGVEHCATLRIVTEARDVEKLKEEARAVLAEMGVKNVTIETTKMPAKGR